MILLLARRLAFFVPLLLFVTLAVNALVYLMPGDPAMTIATPGATEEQIASIRERLRLDDTFASQYWQWLSGAVRGDLGESLLRQDSVSSMIGARLPATMSLTALTLVITVVVSIPIGILAAVHEGRWPDRVVTVLTSLGIALPSFWIGIVLVIVFAVTLGWFPATGYTPLTDDPLDWLRHLLLPAFALAAAASAEAIRQLRGALVDVFDHDYVRTAEAKGLPRHRVLGKHALKNAAAPLVTVLGMQVAMLLGGALIVEQVFAIPGLGQLAIRAVLDRDLPVIQGVVVTATIVVLLANLVVDLVYGYLNPKLRTNP